MIYRDSYGFIVQHSKDDMNYADGGDSCNRDGIMATSGNEQSQFNLPRYIIDGRFVVRHPLQDLWDSPAQISRDAIVAFFSSQSPNLKVRAAALFYASSWFCNKDFLSPSVRLYLYKCAGVKAPPLIRFLGPIFLFFDVLWSTKIEPEHELNQIACICLVMGQKWIDRLISWHPNFEENLLGYWSGWRDQKEIGEAFYTEICKRSTV